MPFDSAQLYFYCSSITLIRTYIDLKSISFKNDMKNSEVSKIWLILPRYFVYKKYQYLVRSTSKHKGIQIKKYFSATPTRTPLSRPPPLNTPKILILQSFRHEFAHFWIGMNVQNSHTWGQNIFNGRGRIPMGGRGRVHP